MGASLDSPGDPVTGPLLHFLGQSASQFNRKRSRHSQNSIASSGRAGADLYPDEWRDGAQEALSLAHLALERWTDAHRLHRQSTTQPLRRWDSTGYASRSSVSATSWKTSCPYQHAAWSDDLKHIQDVLGDVHDLDVLWSAVAAGKRLSRCQRTRHWQDSIHQERAEESSLPHEDEAGKDSLWHVWRKSCLTEANRNGCVAATEALGLPPRSGLQTFPHVCPVRAAAI